MAAGDAITVAKPWFYLGELYPTAAVVPPRHLALRGTWGANWTLSRGYVNGVQLTFQNPRAAIGSSDLGILGYVGTGAHGQQMQIQFRKPTEQLIRRLGSLYKVTKALVPAVPGPPAVPAMPETDLWFQDATDELDSAVPTSEFRVGVEGFSQAGGLYSTARTMRYIGFRAQQGGNFVARWDHTGNDAGIFPTMTAQMLPYTVVASDLTSSGLDASDFSGKDSKGVWMNIAPAA